MNVIRKPKKVAPPWPRIIHAVATADDFWAVSVYHRKTIGSKWEQITRFGEIRSDTLSLVLLPQVRDAGILVVMADAFATLTAMGFWDSLRRKDVRLRGVDERHSTSPRCVVEDPPTIIQYSFRSLAGSHVVCDPRNWGYVSPSSDDCEFDVLSLHARIGDLMKWISAYDKMIMECDLGESWRCTAGSQSFYGFRQNYMHAEIPATRPSDGELIANASYGGRCECFHVGEVPGPIYQYDFNQLYSSAALADVPVEFIGNVDACLGDELLSPREVAAHVEIGASVPNYPVRCGYGREAMTIYPIGKFTTFLAGPELAAAQAAGHLLRVISGERFRCNAVLADWAERLYAYRLDSPSVLASTVKMLSLSLYGKFGQHAKEWHVDEEDCPPPGLVIGDWYTRSEGSGVRRHRVLDGRCLSEIAGEYAAQASPSISAWITSQARTELSTAIKIAQADCVLYCDTDSVWVTRDGHDRIASSGLVSATGLGKLRLVADWEYVDFRGLKHYVASGKLKHAGVPDKAICVGSNLYKWQEQATFASHMSSREFPHHKIIDRSYRGTRIYRHGVVCSDGTVMPHELSLE